MHGVDDIRGAGRNCSLTSCSINCKKCNLFVFIILVSVDVINFRRGFIISTVIGDVLTSAKRDMF